MTVSGAEDKGLREKHAASIAKVRAWRVRANQARMGVARQMPTETMREHGRRIEIALDI